jgi:threonine aldolase
MIDLRSDTVTKPTPEMRRAMLEAEVGDDVYGEDPTVNLLEKRAAAIAGKEDALFVPTGTMGNTIAIKLHTHHGEEVICDVRAHILEYELSMLAWFAGCVGRAIPTPDGIMSWEQIAREIRPLGPHRARTAMIEIENSNNIAGGTVYPMGVVNEICDKAHALGLRVHMDGARVFNAAEYLGKPVKEIVGYGDVLPFEGVRRAGGLDVGGHGGGYSAGTLISEAVGRRHAAGGGTGGGGLDRVGE